MEDQANANPQGISLPIRTGSNQSPQKSKNTEVAAKNGSDDSKEDNVQARSKKRKKVSFATAEDEEKQSTAMSKPSPSKSEIADFSFNSGSKVLELNDEDKPIRATPVIPTAESPEDAALRREMIEYSLNEVGSVVAELDLCEEEDDDYSSMSEESGSDTEDKYGRRIGRNISSSYRAQMLELQRKVEQSTSNGELNGAGDTEIAGAGPENEENAHPSSYPETQNLPLAPNRPKTRPKKSLRFADKVQVHHLPKEGGQSKKKPKKSNMAKKSRIEHKPLKKESSTTPQAPEKRPAETLAATIVEREVKERPTSETSEFDTENLLREARLNYYDIRNRAIERQGGFMPSEEEEDNPLMEEHDGKVRKVSRFKAARLKKTNV